MAQQTKPQTRIITGTLKGRALDLPGYTTVRPTRERVRQSIFNMLASRMDLAGLAVLDLFCGSGAWGLEALSRGAARVTLVDSDTRAVARNVASLGVAVEVVQADVAAWAPTAPADVVMLDPPYGKGLVEAVLQRADAFGAAGSWWAIECGADEAPAMDGFEVVKTEVYGVSKVILARRG